MDNYKWQHNKAVTDRMYYSERVFTTTTLFATFFTAGNLTMIRNGYFADVIRARIIPTWKYWALTNLIVISVLQIPLT